MVVMTTVMTMLMVVRGEEEEKLSSGRGKERWRDCIRNKPQMLWKERSTVGPSRGVFTTSHVVMATSDSPRALEITITKNRC